MAGHMVSCCAASADRGAARLASITRDAPIVGIIECRSPDHQLQGGSTASLFDSLVGNVWTGPRFGEATVEDATCIAFDGLFTYAFVLNLDTPRADTLVRRLPRNSGHGPQSP